MYRWMEGDNSLHLLQTWSLSGQVLTWPSPPSIIPSFSSIASSMNNGGGGGEDGRMDMNVTMMCAVMSQGGQNEHVNINIHCVIIILLIFEETVGEGVREGGSGRDTNKIGLIESLS